MARKAVNPIPLPKGVEAKVNGQIVTVKGPKGQLTQELRAGVIATVKDGMLSVTLAENETKTNYLGLYWALLTNMVTGVAEGFKKQLEMIGVGYRAAVQGNLLDLQIGCSHPVKIPIPSNLKVEIEKSTLLTIQGIDKQKVGQFAADIRSKRPPEPYKGKGIRYVNEFVRRKAGKAGKGAK